MADRAAEVSVLFRYSFSVKSDSTYSPENFTSKRTKIGPLIRKLQLKIYTQTPKTVAARPHQILKLFEEKHLFFALPLVIVIVEDLLNPLTYTVFPICRFLTENYWQLGCQYFAVHLRPLTKTVTYCIPLTAKVCFTTSHFYQFWWY